MQHHTKPTFTSYTKLVPSPLYQLCLALLKTVSLMHRVMGDLALAAAVDRHLAPTALLELHLGFRLIQLVALTSGVSAPDELFGQLHLHPLVYS